MLPPDFADGPANSDVRDRFPFLGAPRGPGELGWIGPYRVRGVLGEGGMGVVFDADDTQLGRRVAVKVLKSGPASDAVARERSLREARTAAALASEYVVTIYHVGTEGNVSFLVMQYLQGESLEQALRRRGRLPVADVLHVGRQVALGLAVAHDQGVIHRDVKPANIWLETSPDGHSPPRIKLLDFGLARTAGAGPLTAPGMVLGTPHYMAPEQAQGRALDGRCDLFGLGCVLYRMLTGVMPFDGHDLEGVLTALIFRDPRPIRDLAPDTPPALAELIGRLLAKFPGDRPATAREVAERLRALQGTPGLPPSSPVRETDTSALPAGHGPGRWCSWRFASLVAMLALILAGWAWLLAMGRAAAP